MIPIVRLDASHLSAVIALHHEVVADSPPGLVAAETDEFFRFHLDEGGCIFGAFVENDLIAYSVLGIPRAGDPNFGVDHGLAEAELPHVAHIDGVSVRKDFRKQGWQLRMIGHRLAYAYEHQRNIALSTAAPGNIASVVNLLSAGMEICGLIRKFGGDRYLFRLDLTEQVIHGAPKPPQDITRWCRMTDAELGKTWLAEGYAGVSCRRSSSDGIPEIGWVRRYC